MKKVNLIRNICLFLLCFNGLGTFISVLSLDEIGVSGLIFYAVLTVVFYILYNKYNKQYIELKKQVPEKKEVKVEIEPHPKADSIVKPAKEEEPIPLSFPDTYIVFDVETPNRKNDSICQLGLVVVEHGEIIKDYSTLINPQDDFDYVNTKIHGIDRSMILHSPTIKDYWETIGPLFDKYVVVGHNTKYDMTVLCKTLIANDIKLPKFKYVCTLVECQNRLPELSKYDLTSLCTEFDVDIQNQHNARYDIIYLSKLFEKLVHDEKFILTPQEFSFTSSRIKPIETPSNDLKMVEIDFDEIDEIDFNSKFVLTGLFDLMSKKEITSFIEENGGKVTSGVSKLTKYLIVGTYKEPAWKYGEYGTKIIKALELKETTGIKIISEKDFVNYIE